ncbi:MAG: MBL fold metallo-hydrolase [Bacteroidetes bacterium]|nr:MBL fold metallo-hydrolase [Bacteroidota bacterium]MBK9424350.1 MBL fold metallo-hydrolase [Bacteroidota bacterium]MBL0071573.1 MBL fold metallo-hydrolase [Bacteroidota bacterium]
MYIEQLYTSCLAEAAYYIESDGEAAIIDPMREVSAYLDLAQKRGAVIKYVFETHFHADFVSGHLDLAAQTGAEIVYGPTANPSYSIICATDGQEFKIGRVTLKVLHTPGHTLESSCFLLLDERHHPHSIFTGDTLFVGEVGRPDLAVKENLTKFELAGMLYESIESKLKPLPNYVVVYPGHGEGSACGKAIGKETFSTIGIQKSQNYALKARSKEDFVKLVTEGLNDPPAYFFMDAVINRKGYDSIDTVIKRNNKPLSVSELKKSIEKQNAIIVDCRTADAFGTGFIPGSVNIGLDGSFAMIAGGLLNPEIPIILVVESGKNVEAILRLSRIGYENVVGYLEGGIEAWKNAGEKVDTIPSVDAILFLHNFRYTDNVVLDVRFPDEWVPGFVAGAKLIELFKLEQKVKELDREKNIYIYCAGGYRSMVAASILHRLGFKNLFNISGGMKKIQKTAIPIRQITAQLN